jgi:carbon-monoxide dehydrogenase small subunit
MVSHRDYIQINLSVNGESRLTVVRPADTLLWVLRNSLGLYGTKRGCENGDCGACTVLIDEKPSKSCMILAVEVEGQDIITVEGLHGTAIQEAFIQKAGFQCGFCTPGFLLNCYALLKRNPDPSDSDIQLWLESNLCRCTGYEGIEGAVKAAVKNKNRSIFLLKN